MQMTISTEMIDKITNLCRCIEAESVSDFFEEAVILKKEIDTLQQEANTVKMQCKRCKYFQPDFEYAGSGTCQNSETMNRIMMGHVDMFLLADDFGCIFAEAAEQTLASDHKDAEEN